MAYLDQHLKDTEYKNWVINTVALNITLDVLKLYVAKELPNIQASIIKDRPPGAACSLCDVKRVPDCPNNLCNVFQNEITANHRKATPSFCNTNAKRWTTDAWEIAKCFMPPLGGYKNCTIEDADFPAVISIIINCKHFDTLVSCDLNQDMNIFRKANAMRNMLVHTYSLKVSKDILKQNLDLLMKLLICFKDRPSKYSEALEEIKKLKTEELHITMDNVLNARKQAASAILEEIDKEIEETRDSVDLRIATVGEEKDTGAVAEGLSRGTGKPGLDGDRPVTMAYLDQHLKDTEYKNWVINTMALKITVDVLKFYVAKALPNIQASIIKDRPPGAACSLCDVKSVPDCPNNLCNVFQNEIIANHRKATPSFCNTNAKRWTTDAWEIAKCFMPPVDGYKNCTLEDADIPAVISIIINCKHFDALVSCDLNQDMNIFHEAKAMRNMLVHTYSLKVSNDILKQNLDLLMKLLTCFKDRPSKYSEALEEIKKLKTEELHITMDNVFNSRKQAASAILEEIDKEKEETRDFVDLRIATVGEGKDTGEVAEGLSRGTGKPGLDGDRPVTMAYLDQHLKDTEHKNWVINTVAIKITVDVLKLYVAKELPNIQASIIKDRPPGAACSLCDVKRVPRCPNNLCNVFRNEIIANHRNATPSFCNTNAKRWTTDAWEIAKCFMPPVERYKNFTLEDVDIPAVISIIINCKHFDDLVSCDLNQDMNIFRKAKDMRNMLVHTYSLKVSNDILKQNLDLLMKLLTCFKDRPSKYSEALEEIKKLKTEELHITMDNVLEARKQAASAISEEIDKEKEEIRDFVNLRIATVGEEKGTGEVPGGLSRGTGKPGLDEDRPGFSTYGAVKENRKRADEERIEWIKIHEETPVDYRAKNISGDTEKPSSLVHRQGMSFTRAVRKDLRLGLDGKAEWLERPQKTLKRRVKDEYGDTKQRSLDVQGQGAVAEGLSRGTGKPGFDGDRPGFSTYGAVKEDRKRADEETIEWIKMPRETPVDYRAESIPGDNEKQSSPVNRQGFSTYGAVKEDRKRADEETIEWIKIHEETPVDYRAKNISGDTEKPSSLVHRQESLRKTPSNDRILDIVHYIKMGQNAIQAVGACFNPESKKFDITVVSKQPNEVRSQIEELVSKRSSRLPDYDLKVRNISEEGIDVTQTKEFIEFFEEKGYSKEIFKIQRIIYIHSDTLLTDFPNITSVSFSPVKSTGYGTSDHVILKEPCIVIFVDIKFDKNRIPLRSKRIPDIIGGIKTDVREGFVESLMHEPQNTVSIESSAKINCNGQIGSSGPFVSCQNGRIGFLTSFHVLLSPQEIGQFMSLPSPVNLPDRTVYKVTRDGLLEMGNVKKVYFSTGDNTQSKSGYEVGLVQLNPNVDNICDTLQTNGPENYNGETTVITEDNCETLMKKLGAMTGLTQGIYAGQNWLRLQYDETASFVLHCQIGILSAHYERDIHGKFFLRDFAIPGDSGALVTIREGETHKAVGIFTGWRTDGTYIATPIQQICDCLQLDGWEIDHPRNHNNKNEQMDID